MKLIHRIIRKVRGLHTFDVLFLSCILLIGCVFLVQKFQRQSEWVTAAITVAPDEWWWVAQKPDPWYGTGITPGLTSYNTFGEKVAEITDVRNYEASGGKHILLVTLSLKTDYDKKKKVYSFSYQPLQVGGVLNLTFGTQNIRGLVTSVGDQEPLKPITIEAKLQYVFPWVAESLTKGMEAKDTLGRTVARIEEMEITGSQSYEFIDRQDRAFVIRGEDPARKDVTMKLSLQARQYNGTFYYFDGSPVKIGNGIHLEFPGVTVQYAEISRIFQ